MAYSWQHYRLVFPIYVDFLEQLNDVILEKKILSFIHFITETVLITFLY